MKKQSYEPPRIEVHTLTGQPMLVQSTFSGTLPGDVPEGENVFDSWGNNEQDNN